MSTSSTFPASRASGALDYFQVPGTDERVAEYAQHKQQMVVVLIQAGDFTAYPDALRFAIATKDAGIQAAKAGGMAAIGIARADDTDLLAAANADLVVTTLDDVDTTALRQGRLARRQALASTTTPSHRDRAAAHPGPIFMPRSQ